MMRSVMAGHRRLRFSLRLSARRGDTLGAHGDISPAPERTGAMPLNAALVMPAREWIGSHQRLFTRIHFRFAMAKVDGGGIYWKKGATGPLRLFSLEMKMP